MERKDHGIKCDVENCEFNHLGKECNAASIEVCGTCCDPDCCDETICNTFRPRNS